MKKQIDAVRVQHEGARRVQSLLAGKSRDEELAFWREATARLRRRQVDKAPRAANARGARAE